jgi:hypothetical protein
MRCGHPSRASARANEIASAKSKKSTADSRTVPVSLQTPAALRVKQKCELMCSNLDLPSVSVTEE